ncbi:MAG: DNA mismatch repair endonuclease MutL [Clostridia bacterium]|nr:DNA mismatch repair endonuclease MutL [Clostridia bacterium]
MGIINVLDFSVANLIAAGEVVDRPASVIKELLENSIDAGADDITVEIKRGGITFMRVTDNGKGIAKDDLPVAVKRHATSKIHNADDLDSILTLGFRGEALAAIASVSRLRIMSKTAECDTGHILESSCGEVKGIIEAGCANGTTVIVEDLFANVPARLKFLKKDVTEAMAVSAYVEKIALSRPDISIKLIIDGNMKFMTSGDNKLYNVIYVLFGKDFAKRLIEVDNNSDGVRVHGYIGAPDNIRANRNFQNFFINGRFIKSKTVSAALEQAYSAFIPGEKFPCAVLNVDISPAHVDVNVHPAKLEVKFSNEKLVFEAVYSTVRQALENKIERPEFKINPYGDRITAADYMKRLNSFIPVNDGKRESAQQLEFTKRAEAPALIVQDSVQVGESKPFEPVQADIPVVKAEEKEPEFVKIEYGVSDQNMSAAEPFKAERAPVANIEKDDTPAPFDSPYKPVTPVSELAAPVRERATDAQTEPEDEIKVPEYRIIGEAFYSYVFVETGDSVLIIDKHAAHERIIFEELKNNLKKKNVVSQMMLVPIDIVMTNAEACAVGEYADELKKTGFELEVYGNTVSITEIPIELDADAVVPLMQTIADRISNGTGNITVSRDIIYEKALFQASCKAAVKIGHIHDEAHLKWIVEKVLTLDIIKFCPHGRPVAFELTRHDFERQFKRV